MNDDRIERLLRGYPLPGTPGELDRRVLEQAERILVRAGARAAVIGVVREIGNVLGFGYIDFIVDLVSANDAEYQVEFV